jgi:hypothetical protein
MTANGAGSCRALWRSPTQLPVLAAVGLPLRPLEGSTTPRGGLLGGRRPRWSPSGCLRVQTQTARSPVRSIFTRASVNASTSWTDKSRTRNPRRGSARFEVSQSVTREALIRLAEKGLVVARAWSGSHRRAVWSHGSARIPAATGIMLFDCYIEISVVGFSRPLVLGAAPSPSGWPATAGLSGRRLSFPSGRVRRARLCGGGLNGRHRHGLHGVAVVRG